MPAPAEKETKKLKIDAVQLSKHRNAVDDTSNYFPFYYTLEPVQLQCYIPALQSFVYAQYNGLWIFIGGEKKGFHGTASFPPPFQSKVANDSIWVIDVNRQQSWSVAVPAALSTILCATNSEYTQLDSLLYMCGGFTRTKTNDKVFNNTSNNFLEINLNSLVNFVQSGGSSMPFGSVITKQVQDPYVQVTGGTLMYNNNYFYLIGGQNYNTAYNAGVTGVYTNAIRRFSLQNQNGAWVIADTASLIDTVNLHRRDMNLVPGPGQGFIDAVLYGGVFTKNDLAYRNAVFISGLSTANPSIALDTSIQRVNQYSCAVASYADTNFNIVLSSFFGGITHEMYDKDSGKLVVGDHGVAMPFSNITSTMVSDSYQESVEFIQVPPIGPLLPGYIGANAIFIPAPEFTMKSRPRLLDLAKINADTTLKNQVGYLFGGIVSMGPTSGTTPDKFVPTFANPVLYKVYLNTRVIQ
jgi:hypothetical protein